MKESSTATESFQIEADPRNNKDVKEKSKLIQ